MEAGRQAGRGGSDAAEDKASASLVVGRTSVQGQYEQQGHRWRRGRQFTSGLASVASHEHPAGPGGMKDAGLGGHSAD